LIPPTLPPPFNFLMFIIIKNATLDTPTIHQIFY
jgi:hypothetical protein